MITTPVFESAEALADWLESLHESDEAGAVSNRKWAPAQIAATAVRASLRQSTVTVTVTAAAIRAFQLAEQSFGERMQSRGVLFDPALGVEAGLLAALPHIERIKADEGAVTDDVVERAFQHACEAMGGYNSKLCRKSVRAALLAVWPTPPAQATQVDAVPDPLGCNDCTHPGCGRYNGPRSVECRAMLNNACARPAGNQPYRAPTTEPVARVDAWMNADGGVCTAEAKTKFAHLRDYSIPLVARSEECHRCHGEGFYDTSSIDGLGRTVPERRVCLKCNPPEPVAQGEVVAWMVPYIASFDSDVAWKPQVLGSSIIVIDRYGIEHRPRPLAYTTPPAPTAEPAAQGEAMVDFAGIGFAGPFPIKDGKIELPQVTLDDLCDRIPLAAQPRAVPSVPDGWVKPEEIEAYRRRTAKPRGTAGGGFGVFVSDTPDDIYSRPIYFNTTPTGMPDANRFHFIVKYNWIGTKTRCERHIQDGDLDSARRAVDAAMLAAAPSPGESS